MYEILIYLIFKQYLNKQETDSKLDILRSNYIFFHLTYLLSASHMLGTVLLSDRDVLVNRRDPVSSPAGLTVCRGLETRKQKIKIQYNKCCSRHLKKSPSWLSEINEIIWRKIPKHFRESHWECLLKGKKILDISFSFWSWCFINVFIIVFLCIINYCNW